jgi:hypothetical protein
MSHEERIEKVIRPAAQKCSSMIRAKFPNIPTPKTLIERRMLEIEEAKKDGCSQDYIDWLILKLPAV